MGVSSEQRDIECRVSKFQQTGEFKVSRVKWAACAFNTAASALLQVQ
jgi:hypothetical protein